MANRRATPDEVQIRTSPREPVTDPTLGIEVPRGAAATTRHRLVTIGDSLTHGFMSAAVHRTDLSWPAITAYELGLTAEQFTFPTYEWPTGPGGLPLDLERLARAFEKRFGAHLDFWEIVTAGLWLRSYMDRIEDYWERGDGSRTPRGGAAVPQHGGLRLGPPRPPAPDRDQGRLPAGPPDQGRPAVAAGGAPPGPGRLAGPAAGPQGQPRPHRPGRRGRHERTRPGRGDAGGRPGLQQRTRRGGVAGARVDTRGVRRPPARGASGRPRRLQPVAPQRVRCRLVLARGEAARDRRPARHHRDGPVGHHRADRPRHLQEGPARSPGTSRTTRGPGSPTTTSTPSAIRTSPARRPGRSTPPSTPTTRR